MDHILLRQELLELLCRFDALCRTHKIDYTLHGGTLLGAVRHQGFIPWDDDADVAMTRENFRKLEAVLQSHDTGCYIKGQIKTQFCPVGSSHIWVDIFICDPITEHPLGKKIKLLLLTALDIMSKTGQSRKLSNLSGYPLPLRIAFSLLFFFGQLFPRSRKAAWYRRVSQNWFRGRASRLMRSNDQYDGRRRTFPAEWMTRYQDISFEGKSLRTLCEYTQLLISCYGEDYMTPKQDLHAGQVHALVRADSEILV